MYQFKHFKLNFALKNIVNRKNISRDKMETIFSKENAILNNKRISITLEKMYQEKNWTFIRQLKIKSKQNTSSDVQI